MEDTSLGQFRIVEKLGEGGMGEVWRARDERLDRDVAIKILPAEVADDHDRLDRFEREAKALARLSHPNILQIFEFGDEQGVTYAVTELLEGETLRERLRRGGLPWQRAVEIGAAIADGLAAAHRQGIVHRDVKPENVFITTDGRVKVLDFGLARVTVPDLSVSQVAEASTLAASTGAGVVLGTVGYMAPEQARGERADARSDIFALGCIVYEMLSGRRPFERESAVETMAAIIGEEPPPLEQVATGLDPGVVRLVARCQAKDAERRYQSAADLAHDLRALLPGAGTAVPPAQRGRPAVTRGSWAGLGVMVLVAALLGLDVGGFRSRLWREPSAEALRSVAVLPLDNLSGDPGQEFFADGMTEALIADLAKVGALKVISRTSVMRFKGTTRPLQEIAAELNVDAVIEGSVLRSGSRVRITAQLIEAATDHHMWAESYERDLTDVLSLQSEIARAVAEQIRVVLTPAEEQRLGATRQVDPGAYEAYLMGYYHLRKQTTEGAREARRYFEEAIGKDPTSALAYAGLVAFYVDFGPEVLPRDELEAKAETAALRALELDDTLAETHLALGNVRLWLQWRFADAEKELTKAIDLNPGLAQAHHGRAHYLWIMGRHEDALAESRLYLELDPLSPWPNDCLAWHSMQMGRYESALALYRKALELDPDYYFAHTGLGNVYALQGKLQDAEDRYRTALEVSDETFSWAALSLAHLKAVAGDRSGAEEILLGLDEGGTNFLPTGMAMVRAALGDTDEAFRWLERAYQVKDQLLLYLRTLSFLDPLRDDPRFADLLRRMGLPED